MDKTDGAPNVPDPGGAAQPVHRFAYGHGPAIIEDPFPAGPPEVQFYLRKGKPTLRAVPYSSKTEFASDAQLETRLRFGEAAQAARGRKHPPGKSPAVAAVSDAMRGFKSSFSRARMPIWKQRLLGYLSARMGTEPNGELEMVVETSSTIAESGVSAEEIIAFLLTS